jgi:hypothetical protein
MAWRKVSNPELGIGRRRIFDHSAFHPGKDFGFPATHSSRRIEILLHVSVNGGGGGRGEGKEGILPGGA